jgi:L-asparagine oxygenase
LWFAIGPKGGSIVELSGLRALAGAIGAGVCVDGAWLEPDAGTGPIVVLATTADGPLPSPTPGRRTLVARAPLNPVVDVDPADPLVATTRVVAHGCGSSDGLRVHLDEVGHVRGDVEALAAPVLQVGDTTVAAVDAAGRTVVAGVRWLDDALLAAGDNARFLVRAVTGDDDPALVALVHGVHGERRPHALPPVLRAGAPEPLGDLPAPGTPLDAPAFAAAVRRATRLLPAEVHEALLAFADESDPSGALLVRGLPVGDLPPTPSTPETPVGKDRTSELVLLAAGRLLGQPVGYLPEHGGDVVQNLVPTPDGAARQVSTSSAVTLAWHTEAAFHPHRPRFLLLLCLRGDPAARTTLCSIRQIVDALPLRTRRILSEPRFRTAADESYVGARSERRGHPVAVLRGDPAAPQLLYDADLMTGTDPEAQAALDELAELVEASHTSVVLEPGDLLVVDNTVAVHGRSPFPARYDGTDRWLQRAFVVADLAPSAAVRTGRVVRTRFAA